MPNNFNENYKKGCEVENFIKKIYKGKNASFIAGNNGENVVNINLIERIYHCKYVPPGYDEFEQHNFGPRLDFNGLKITMPDLLFNSRTDNVFWVECKSSRNTNFHTIDVAEKDILDYREIENRGCCKVWMALCFIDTNMNKATIKVAKISEIIGFVKFKSQESFFNRYYNENVYRIDPDWSIFQYLYVGEYP